MKSRTSRHALAEQRDHVHVGARVTRDHAEHGALADA
jgi:hypothetical protein